MASYDASVATPDASQPLVNFTDSAAAKVHELIQEEDNPALCLRVYITGGGCSGFQYGFAFEESIAADDTVVEKTIQLQHDDAGGSGTACVKLLIDSLSFQYLSGADIDYREDIQGAQFVIRNPNAKTTCGCGSSFTV